MWTNPHFSSDLFTFTKANRKPIFFSSVMDIEKEELCLI